MKIRLFVKPPQKPSVLLELIVPEEPGGRASQLKCFSPPPDNRTEQAEFGKTRAWAVDVEPDEVARIADRARDIRIVPFVDTRPRGYGGSPVEVVISDGQAEARLSWWLNPPEGWTVLDELVQHLVEMSQRAGSALPVELAPEDDEPTGGSDRPGPGPRSDPDAAGGSGDEPRKKGFFRRLLGG